MPEPRPDARPSAAETSIVLGVETQIGLAIVRELGRAGVRVVAITTDAGSVGAASRHVDRVVCVTTLRSADTVRAVNEIAARHGRCSLITVSEANLHWLLQVQGDFDAAVRPALPPAAAFAVATDKDRTLRVAAGLGIDVPVTAQPLSFDELAAIAARFRYPAVLKWGTAGGHDLAALLDRYGLEHLKAEYVYSADELLAVGRRYAPLGCYPLIQEYCAGQGFGQFFFMHGGAAVRRFQHVRVAEWPPEGGFSSVCDAVPLSEHARLQERSIALLQAIGWDGVAMVEYRVDLARGRAVLMEINGRFWGSFPLAYHAGAGFALFAHRAALGLPLDNLPPPLAPLRCRMVATELKRLLRLVFRPGLVADRQFPIRPWRETLRFVADFFRPRVRYYVWSWDDPRPSWADLRNAVADRFGATHA